MDGGEEVEEVDGRRRKVRAVKCNHAVIVFSPPHETAETLACNLQLAGGSGSELQNSISWRTFDTGDGSKLPAHAALCVYVCVAERTQAGKISCFVQ